MKEVRVTYRDWELYSDKEMTEQTYLQLEHSGAESCGCEYCRNFIAQRETVFPEEIKVLFGKLGINYKKEVDVSEFAKLENGLYYYNGCFHFEGGFIGEDCSIALPNGGYSIKLTQIADNFKIGFCRSNILAPFKDKNGLVQIEFDCYLPWVLPHKPK